MARGGSQHHEDESMSIHDSQRTSLLVVAHGSRRRLSNDEVRCLARRMTDHARGRFREVRAAFLELAEPSIPDGIQECIDAGAERVVVVPYFLTAGRHVVEDIPRDVETKRTEHPHVDIVIAPYLGEADAMVELMLTRADDGVAEAGPLMDSAAPAAAAAGR
jgi:sirohydrochlorin ferrochelatase